MKRHLLVTGPGRSGTTLLVQILTEAGVDTGAEQLVYHPESNAGLETQLGDRHAAYVVKRPNVDLAAAFASGSLVPELIDMIVVPLRDLDQAVLSRKYLSASTSSPRVLGGLEQTRNPYKQASILTERFYRLVETAVNHDIPVRLIAYPRFATDPHYAWRRLGDLMDADEERFFDAWRRAIDPGKVRLDRLDDSPWLDMRLVLKWVVNGVRARLPLAKALRRRRRQRRRATSERG